MSQSFTKKRDPMKTHSALQGLDVLPSESQGFWCHERAHGRPACTAQCATCRATEDEASDGVNVALKLYRCDACDWKGNAQELVQQCVPCCPLCLGDVSEADADGVRDQVKGGE